MVTYFYCFGTCKIAYALVRAPSGSRSVLRRINPSFPPFCYAYTVKMGREVPSESRAPSTADLSKVRDSGISKAQQPKKENKTLSPEDETKLSGILAGLSDRSVGDMSRPEVIDLDSESSDESELESSEVAEDDEDGDKGQDEIEDEDEDEDEDEVEDEDEDDDWADDTWKDEWEEEGDDVTQVQLPQPKTSASPLTIRRVFIVTTEHEIRDPFDDKHHEMQGVYSHVLDANKAAQEHAQRRRFALEGDRYKERIYHDGTFHARAKGGRDERLSVDVEEQFYMVRQEAPA